MLEIIRCLCVHILLGNEGGVATIFSATCECAAGYVRIQTRVYQMKYTPLSFTVYCVYIHITHISAVLRALTSLSPMAFRLQPNLSATDDTDDETLPITSLPCQWKAPKTRKESTLKMSVATFQKHEYVKPAKKPFGRL